jgi:hypothetical protein
MSGLLSDLRQRLLPAYLFLVVYSTAGLAIVGVPAPGWGLKLADLRLPEADLRSQVLPRLGLPGRWHKRCGYYAWVIPLLKAPQVF